MEVRSFRPHSPGVLPLEQKQAAAVTLTERVEATYAL
jgi:hypothetical protein